MFPDVILLSNDSYSDILVLSISYDKGITKSKKMSRITHIYTPNSFRMYSERVHSGERSTPLPGSH